MSGRVEIENEIGSLSKKMSKAGSPYYVGEIEGRKVWAKPWTSKSGKEYLSVRLSEERQESPQEEDAPF